MQFPKIFSANISASEKQDTAPASEKSVGSEKQGVVSEKAEIVFAAYQKNENRKAAKFDFQQSQRRPLYASRMGQPTLVYPTRPHLQEARRILGLPSDPHLESRSWFDRLTAAEVPPDLPSVAKDIDSLQKKFGETGN